MEKTDQSIATLVEMVTQLRIGNERLQATLDNGIKVELKRAVETVEKLDKKISDICTGYDERLEVFETRFDEIEKFAWFRKKVNAVRDDWFFYIIVLGVVGGMAVVVARWGNDLFTKFISG